MIHVCYAVTDRSGYYCKFLGTAMLSVMLHTKHKLHFHILCDSSVALENKDKIEQLVDLYGHRLSFYDVQTDGQLLLELFNSMLSQSVRERFSLATTYRLLMFDLLPEAVTKVVYLDVDTYVTCDIYEVWNQDLGTYPIGAVQDTGVWTAYHCFETKYKFHYNPDEYFNAGVLVLKRDGWFNNTSELIHYAQSLFETEPEQIIFPDQNLLNCFFATRWFKLPARFNRLVAVEKYHNRWTVDDGICHYSRELSLDFEDPYCKAFFHYFTLTPWYDYHFLRRLSMVIGQMEKDAERSLVWNDILRQL